MMHENGKCYRFFGLGAWGLGRGVNGHGKRWYVCTILKYRCSLIRLAEKGTRYTVLENIPCLYGKRRERTGGLLYVLGLLPKPRRIGRVTLVSHIVYQKT